MKKSLTIGMPMQLSEIKFTDVYLGESRYWFGGSGSSDDATIAPDNILDSLQTLRAICSDHSAKTNLNEFTVRYEERSYRVSLMQTVREQVFVLRKFPEFIPKFDSLGIHDGIIQNLMTPKMTGLVIISGAFGQGKTTTASAYAMERLNKFGGITITLEDPPEMPLEGHHGKGVCYQTWVENGDFADAMKKAARWAPTVIFLGEVRDGPSASEALKASINGRLVICTLHADSVISSIERMHQMAVSNGSPPDEASSVLANGLSAVLHQKLEGEAKRLQTEFLFLRNDSSIGAKNIIRDRKFNQLGNEITLQMNKMIMQKSGRFSSSY